VRRDLIRRSHYLVPNSLVVTRGCPQYCDCCYEDAFFAGGRSFYTQRVDDALAEIARLPDRHLYFLDDHLLGDRRFAGALFHMIRARQLRRMTPVPEAVLAKVTGKPTLPAPATAGAGARFQIAHRPPQCNDRRPARTENEADHIGEEP
jgi:hypothetical protein